MAMNFTDAQTRAYKAMGENVLVSAGAGSGKTQVLTERVRYLVQEHGYHIDEFLILTFTNLAAGEMKSRIRSKLIEINSPEAKFVDNASICTFDSYALSIAKKYHNYLNIDKNVSIVDSNVISILIRNQIEKELDRMYEEGNQTLLAFLKRFDIKDDKNLKTIVFKVYNAALNSVNTEEYLQKLEALSNPFRMNHYLSELNDMIDNCMNQVYELLCDITTGESYIKSMTKIIDGYNELSTIDEKVNYLYNFGRLPSSKPVEEKDLTSQISDLINGAKKFFKEYRSEEIYHKIAKEDAVFAKFIIDMVRKLYTIDQEYKKAHQTYGFTDIAKMSIDLFKKHPEVASEIRDGLKTIMIDEYQDTSPIQEEFVSLIANNNVYQVGDVKQSIYRFRNATPEIFIKKFNDYAKHDGGALYCLADNFRSRPEVLDDINLMFSKIMTEEMGGANYKKDHIIGKGNKSYDLIGKTDQDNHLEIYRYDDSTDSNDLIEATIIVQDIIKKINSGYLVFDRNGLRPCKFSDFCILSDKKNYFAAIEKVFGEYQVPIFIEYNQDIKDDSLVLTLCSVLKLISFVDKKIYDGEFIHAFMSVGRSYLYRLSDNELYLCVKNKTFDDSIIIKDIKEIIKRNKGLPTYYMIMDMVKTLKVYEKLVTIGSIKKNEKNLDKFLQSLESLNNLDFEIEDYIAYFEGVNEYGLKIDVASSSTDFDSVKMMNIYKSKGLEFPIIYCMGMMSNFNREEYKEDFALSSEDGIIFMDDMYQKTFIHKLYKTRNELTNLSERLRLFYVELTRAKEKMICLLPLELKISPLEESINFANVLAQTASDFKNVTFEIEENLKLNPQEISKVDKVELKCQEIKLDFKEKERTRHASKEVDLSASKTALIRGEELHFLLETIDFMKPDYSLIKSPKDLILIKNFCEMDLIKKLHNPKFFKEYEFVDSINHTNGIIDCLIVDGENAYIIDYKLKHIDDERYVNQLKVYYSYVKTYFNIEPKCYLYSILDSTYKLVDIN